MLAPLIIDLLYACTLMLAFGWAYDFVHATVSLGRREARLATAAPCSKLGQKWNTTDGTIIHA
jgi:hypothetical protein